MIFTSMESLAKVSPVPSGCGHFTKWAWSCVYIIIGCIPGAHHANVLEGHGGEGKPLPLPLLVNLPHPLIAIHAVLLSPPNFTPLKLEHAEQLELGYLPMRDDFEREHDNSAETLVSGLMVGEEDEDLEKSLKLAHVNMYSQRLQERTDRKG